MNTYTYVGGNPVNLTDPFGLTPGIDSSPSRGIGGIVGDIYDYFCPPDDKLDCHKASPWDLKQAGIVGKGAEHKYKKEHGAVPESHFDICKCTDGSIRIAKVGQCGKTSDFWD